MRHRIFWSASLLSLLLFVGTVVLWVRSYWVSDRLTISRFRDVPPWTYWTWDEICTGRGGIGFDRLVQSGELRTFRADVVGMMKSGQGDSMVRLRSHSPGYPDFRMGVGDVGKWGFKKGRFANFDSSGRLASYGTQLVVPMWFLAILTLVMPTIALARRKRQTGGCSICGYNLTGNTSGVCPECGTAVTKKSRAGG